jgi:hypothetical protein
MRVVRIPWLLCLAASMLACDASPGPAGPSRLSPFSTRAGLEVVRLDIAGPDSVPPGASVQLTAIAELTDGSSRDVTGTAEWGSHGGLLPLSVSSTGLVTAGSELGNGFVTARYSGLPYVNPGSASATREVIVVPAGTYRLYGFVTDEDVYLNDVRVDVVSTAGPASGASVTADGYFRFYGVSGDTEIRVSKDGYETEIRHAVVTGHHTEGFSLRLSRPRPTADGTYTLEVTASAGCRDALPEAARRRVYRAIVRQDGAKLNVSLDGAGLVIRGSGFAGSIEPAGVRFSLFGYLGDEPGFVFPSVLEELDVPLHHLTFFGQVLAPAARGGFAGTLDGNIDVISFPSPWDYGTREYEVVARCHAVDHAFVLAR